MKALSLFSGIGGLDIACEMAGMEVVAFSEIEPYACEILKRRWPNVPNVGDVRNITRDLLENVGVKQGEIDIVFGGFPCQPFSVAGKRRGKSDDRFLWPEFSRIVREISPVWIVAENVSGLINLALDDVLSDLESENYETGTFVYPASAVGAPHKRERLFVVGIRKDVAYPRCPLRQGTVEQRAHTVEESKELANITERSSGTLWPTPTCRDYKGANSESGLMRSDGKMCTDQLPNAVKFWLTPRKFMYKDSIIDRNKSNLGEKVGGQLNPDWVECLMGFPVGWTDIDCEEPLPWPGWPALMGQPQYDYEPPRVATKSRNRTKRLKCLGNAVVPQQAYPIFQIIADIHRASLLFKEC